MEILSELLCVLVELGAGLFGAIRDPVHKDGWLSQFLTGWIWPFD
jgi:hypothetical protein